MIIKHYIIFGSCDCCPPKHNGHLHRKYSLGLRGDDACSSGTVSSVGCVHGENEAAGDEVDVDSGGIGVDTEGEDRL